jgi:hypothetical protein
MGARVPGQARVAQLLAVDSTFAITIRPAIARSLQTGRLGNAEKRLSNVAQER